MDKQLGYKRIHLFIRGDVIGVGFRAWTLRQAQSKQLTGWVRNYNQKTVEAVFEGEEEKIKQMLVLCHKGPEVSWVEKVEERWEEATKEFAGFEIRY